MNPAIYAQKSADLDGFALAAFRNRDAAFAMSAATVGKLAAHPPVPRCKSLVPSTVAGHSVPLTDAGSPPVCPAATFTDYGHEMAEAFAFRYLES